MSSIFIAFRNAQRRFPFHILVQRLHGSILLMPLFSGIASARYPAVIRILVQEKLSLLQPCLARPRGKR